MSSARSRLVAVGCALALLSGCAQAFSSQRGGVVIDPWPGGAGRLDDALLPSGFADELVVGGIRQPTAVRWLPSGELLVAEQRGVLTAYPDNGRGAPVQLVDLRTQVFNRSQDGLLGLAVDPDFERRPFVYLAHTLDARIGGQAPLYGRPEADQDECSGGRSDCPAGARIVRITIAGPSAGTEQVLVEDWCMSSRNHTIGTLAFAPDGTLFAGGGDGADGEVLDYGQLGAQPNSCEDPGVVIGAPDTAEGGSLRSQDLRTAGDPTGLAGTIIRIDPDSGEAPDDNPLSAESDSNARRIVAYGLRNPFRFTFRPGTSELWIADVGWRRYEEINRVADALAGPVPNLGWPCFEGPERQTEFDALGVTMCEEIYADEPAALTFPYASLAHSEPRQGGCAAGGTAISAVAFYGAHMFPAAFQGALFLGDAQRRCLWVMSSGDDGLPDPHTVREFVIGAAPVDAQVGPDGALYYVDYIAGEIRRVTYRVPGGGA